MKDVPATVAWYQSIFGLTNFGPVTKGWAELNAGGCKLAFHRYKSNQAEEGPSHVKICFDVPDVAAAKKLLESRGATLGPAKTFGKLTLCDGVDPEGNRFQLSSRGNL